MPPISSKSDIPNFLSHNHEMLPCLCKIDKVYSESTTALSVAIHKACFLQHDPYKQWRKTINNKTTALFLSCSVKAKCVSKN